MTQIALVTHRLLMLLLLSMVVVGCSGPQVHHGNLKDGGVSFELPGAWKEQKENRWTRGMGRNISLISLPENAAVAGVQGLEQALVALDTGDRARAAKELSNTSSRMLGRLRMAPDDNVAAIMVRINEISKDISQAKNPDEVRPILVDLSAQLEAAAKDVETRARTHARPIAKQHRLKLEIERADFTPVDGNPGYVVWCKTEDGDSASYLYWSWEKGDAVIVNVKGGGDGDLLANLASTAVHGEARPKERAPERPSKPISIPSWVYYVGFLVLFTGLPGAFSALVSYENLRFAQREPDGSVVRGSFFPVGLGTLVGCAGLGIVFFSEIFAHGGKALSTNLLAGIVLLVFLGIFLAISIATAVAASYGARLGANVGARVGKFACILGGTIGAMCGAALLHLAVGLYTRR